MTTIAPRINSFENRTTPKPAGAAGGFFYAWISTAPTDIAGQRLGIKEVAELPGFSAQSALARSARGLAEASRNGGRNPCKTKDVGQFCDEKRIAAAEWDEFSGRRRVKSACHDRFCIVGSPSFPYA